MVSAGELKARIDSASSIADPLDRRLWVLACITEYLAASRVKPVLVGGAAVEFYTSGGYFTFDMDLVANSQAMDQAMAELGFQKSGRHWYREDIGITIEAPSESLENQDKICTVEIDDMKVYVIGIEDLIIDRMNAFVHWRSEEDGRWASHLIKENQVNIDWDYLRKKAAEEGTAEALASLAKDQQKDTQ